MISRALFVSVVLGWRGQDFRNLAWKITWRLACEWAGGVVRTVVAFGIAVGKISFVKMTASPPEKKSELVRVLIRTLKLAAVLIMFVEFVLHCLHPVMLFVASTIFLAVVFGLVVVSVLRVNQ